MTYSSTICIFNVLFGFILLTQSSFRDEQCETYKYTEVVRGKDKRAKLNGYFCGDCEKVRFRFFFFCVRRRRAHTNIGFLVFRFRDCSLD